MSKCKHCNNGYLERGDVECVNGVLIDIDVAHEGWQRDVAYAPAPCMACEKCHGTGERGRGQCRACDGSGWLGGENLSQERLTGWASQVNKDVIDPSVQAENARLKSALRDALQWHPSILSSEIDAEIERVCNGDTP